MQEVSWISFMIIFLPMISMNLKKTHWPFLPGILICNWKLSMICFLKDSGNFFSTCEHKTGFYITVQPREYIIVSGVFAGAQSILTTLNLYSKPFSVIMRS